MPTALVTGSNRGIGLEWVRQLGAEGWRVHASCRRPAEATELHELARQHPGVLPMRLDVTHADDVRAVYLALQDQPVDLLVSNAGVYLEKWAQGLGCLRYDDWLRTFDVNTLGHVRITEALIENLAASERRQVIVMTSHMGSIADITAPGSYYYRSSKAALNAAMRGLAAELTPRGITVHLIHPGAVQTRMGGPESRLTTKQSVHAMRRLMDRLGPDESGRFWRYSGEELPW